MEIWMVSVQIKFIFTQFRHKADRKYQRIVSKPVKRFRNSAHYKNMACRILPPFFNFLPFFQLKTEKSVPLAC